MFFEKYKSEVETIYKLKYNKQSLDENDNKKIEAYIKKIKQNYKPVNIIISNTTLQDISEPAKSVDMIQFYDSCRKTNAIFSLSHGIYKSDKSHILEIWDDQIKRRNNFKVKMKDELKLQNQSKVELYTTYQKVFKENANALYGGFGESSFTFFDINNISNLTGTCYFVLLTTINQIEKILGNRILLRSTQEVFDYISYLLEKDTNDLEDIKDSLIYKKAITKLSTNDIDYIVDQFKKYMIFKYDDVLISKIKTIVTNIFNSDDNNRKLVFKYNCNFSKLSDDTNIFNDLITNDFDNFINIEYSEHQFKEKSNVYKSFLEVVVYDNYLQSNLLDLADNYKRSTVMLTDTDSTFCVANTLFNNILNSVVECCKLNNISLNSEQDFKVHAFKIIMFIGETMSDFFLKTLGGKNYQNSKDIRWKLKSEFLYNKILLLKVKKTYFGSILSQEGIRLSPIKFDNKNTELVRTTYSPFTQKFLDEVFKYIVLTEDKELDIYKIIDIIQKYKDEFQRLSEDYIAFSKFGSRSSFKLDKAYKNDPLSVWQYKAALTFNCLFPEEKTLPGDRTMTIPLKSFNCPKNVESEEEVKQWFIDNYGVNEELKRRFIDFFNKPNKMKAEEKLYETLIKDKSINYLAFNYYGTMPECMLDLVDKAGIGLNLIDNRMTRIFDALRLRTYQKSSNSKQKSYFTNILVV